MLGAATYTRRRYAAGSRSDATGRYTPGSVTETTITASVQPLDGRELETLDEGERSRHPLVAYTQDDLRTVSLPDVERADELVIDADRYEVRSVERHRAIIVHNRAVLLRILAEDAP